MNVRTALAALALAPALARGAGTLTGITASPAPATAGSEVAVTVTATGPCRTYVDFGDKTKAAQLTLPGAVKHVYAAAGKYVLKTFSYASGNEPQGLSRCGGFADMELVVNAKVATRALAPGGLKVANPAPSGGGSAAESAPARLPSPTPTKAAK